MKLGQILLHRGKIGREHLREALGRQQQSGRPLGEILLHMGIVARTDILEALRLLPSGSIDGRALRQVRRETATLIPRALAEGLLALPVVHAQGALVVAMADPLDASSVEAIEACVGAPVIPVAADPEDLRAAILHHHAAAALTLVDSESVGEAK